MGLTAAPDTSKYDTTAYATRDALMGIARRLSIAALRVASVSVAAAAQSRAVVLPGGTSGGRLLRFIACNEHWSNPSYENRVVRIKSIKPAL